MFFRAEPRSHSVAKSVPVRAGALIGHSSSGDTPRSNRHRREVRTAPRAPGFDDVARGSMTRAPDSPTPPLRSGATREAAAPSHREFGEWLQEHAEATVPER